MSDTALRSGKLLATILVGAALVAAGVVVDRVLLAPTVDEGSHMEASANGDDHAAEEQEGGHSHDEDAPDHDADGDVPSGTEDGTALVQFSETILDNIGLTTHVVTRGPVEETLLFPGTVRMHPDGVAALSTRIQGKIIWVGVAPGDRVTKGQVLVRIQSLVPGNPPPTVSVVAPMSGIVSLRDAIVGEGVMPNKELFRLIDPRRVVMEARVPERIVNEIYLGQEARVHRLRNHERAAGRVSFIGSMADPVTRTYPVWITLAPSRQEPPRPGQFVDILVIQSRQTVLTVPQQAIVEDGPLRFVFVRRGHAFERRLVKTGAEDEDNVEISSGVAAGDTVAVAGSYELLLALQSSGPGVSDESAPHEH